MCRIPAFAGHGEQAEHRGTDVLGAGVGADLAGGGSGLQDRGDGCQEFAPCVRQGDVPGVDHGQQGVGHPALGGQPVDERFPGREVAVERGDPDSGLPGDLAHRRLGLRGGERGGRRGEHALAIAQRVGPKLFAGELPRGIGCDVSGTVEAVGEGVTDVAAGDRVFGTADYAGQPSAGAADQAVMDHWFAVPEGLDLVQAAALPMALSS